METAFSDEYVDRFLAAARQGDLEPILDLLLDFDRPIPPDVRRLLANILTGREKRPAGGPKLSDYTKRKRSWLERQVALEVEMEMRRQGRKRDKDLRRELTERFCGIWSKATGRRVTKENVAELLNRRPVRYRKTR